MAGGSGCRAPDPQSLCRSRPSQGHELGLCSCPLSSLAPLSLWPVGTLMDLLGQWIGAAGTAGQDKLGPQGRCQWLLQGPRDLLPHCPIALPLRDPGAGERVPARDVGLGWQPACRAGPREPRLFLHPAELWAVCLCHSPRPGAPASPCQPLPGTGRDRVAGPGHWQVTARSVLIWDTRQSCP